MTHWAPSPSVPQMMRRVPLPYFIPFLMLCGTASGTPLQLSGDIGYGCFAQAQRHHGGYGGVTLDASFSDVFGATARYSVSEHRSKGDAQTVHRVGLGALIALDVFEYIPWATFSAVGYGAHGDHVEHATNLGIGFGVGFDRLLDPNWSLGFAAQFDQIFGEDRFPAYMLLGLRVGYRWSPGDEFEP